MNPTISPNPDDFEALLRERLHGLAQHAPATVRMPDEVYVHAAPPRPRRRAGAVTAAFAALVGGIGITTVALNGADEGGAATPEAAVVKMVDAFNNQDVVGMVDTIDPAEVGAVRSTLEEASSEAKRLDLLSDGFSLQSVDGLDFEMSDLTLSTETFADDMAVVSATGGNLAAGFDPDAFPMGGRIREISADMARTAGTVELADVDPRVMVATVQRDGRWYVSLGYTVAEYARRAAGVDFPVVGGVTPEGFDSPEAATTAFYQRLLALDVTGAVATAAPGEGDALARYAPLWLPNVTDSATGLIADGWTLAVESLTFTTSGDGSRRVVTPATFVIAGTVPASVASTDTGMPPFDPALPTQIYVTTTNGESALVIVPVGEPVPDNVAGLPTVSYDDVYAAYGDSPFNYTSALDTGAVVPFADAPAAGSQEPLPMRIEGDGKCTTISGSGAIGWFDPEYSDAWTSVDADRWQVCGVSPLGAVSVITIGLAGGGAATLPAIATVEVDGRWYISPIATITSSVLQALRSIGSTDDLFDSSIAWYLYDIDRASLEQQLTGADVDSLSDACAAIVTVAEGAVTGLLAGVTGPQARACYAGGDVYSTTEYVTESGETVVAETIPAPPDSTPATIAPVASEPPTTDG